MSRRTALVTGAARGIGAATVRALDAAGWSVLAVDRGGDDPRLGYPLGTRAELEAVCGGARDAAVQFAGVSDGEAVATAVAEAERRFGGLDAVICCAPRAGRFLAVASAAAVRGLPQLAAYCASKAGVVGLVHALAVELRGTGVTANAVAPGSTDTAMLEESARLYGLGSAAAFASQQPIERLLAPEEVAAMLVWLAGDARLAGGGTRRWGHRGAHPGRRRALRVSDPSGLLLDPRVRVLDGGRMLVGGDPWRMLRLSEQGAAVLRELLEGAAAAGDGGPAAGGTAAGEDTRAGFARRLIDAGLAHPRPAPAPARGVTVVIPVRDRAAKLDCCLTGLLDHDAPGRVLVVDDGSRDPEAVLAVCARHGCEVIRRERPEGPAAARNAALARIDSGLVALLDSDCVPQPGWLSLLCGALEADPRLGAVAPRVVALGASDTGDADLEVAGAHGAPDPDARAVAAGGRAALARFAAVRSPLDLGPWPSLVRPGGRTAYVPTAALLARYEALGRSPFDPALRLGEDVDLVWRLLNRGWSVRYEPAAVVGHREPARLGSWLLRRVRYGTSAGPLARRHPRRLAPVALPPRTHAALVAVSAGLSRRRPGAAAVAVGAAALHLGLGARGLSRHGVPPRLSWTLALRGLGDSAAALGRAATMLAPVPLTAGLLSRRSRRAITATMGRRPARTLTLIVLLAAPVRDLVRLRPTLDPWRFAALSVADDLAYGTGVWAGALRDRTWRPLQPHIIRPAGAGAADSCDPHG